MYIQIIFYSKIFCKFNFCPPSDFKDSVTNFLMHLFPRSMNPIYPLKRQFLIFFINSLPWVLLIHENIFLYFCHYLFPEMHIIKIMRLFVLGSLMNVFSFQPQCYLRPLDLLFGFLWFLVIGMLSVHLPYSYL